MVVATSPIAAPVKVVAVVAISVGDAKSGVSDFCHLLTVPVCPERVILDGVDTVHRVWSDDTVPPTAAAVIETVVVLELAVAQLPF